VFDNTTGVGNLTGADTTDTNVVLSTVGTVGANNSRSTVTSATITGANASANGPTLTIGTGVDEGVSNGSNSFDAWNDAANSGLNSTKHIGGYTATVKSTPGTYTASDYQTNYTYLVYGAWIECGSGSGCNVSANETGVAGVYVFGQATPVGSIPTSGQAVYTGSVDGTYFPGGNNASMNVTADLLVNADFSTRNLGFTTSHSAIYNNTTTTFNQNGTFTVTSPDYIAKPELNLSGMLNYSASSNYFSGLINDVGGRTGPVVGRFFGPAAQEIGGAYAVRDLNGSANFGTFVGKK
jgi:hypothetical protein